MEPLPAPSRWPLAINQYVGLKDGKNTVEDYVKYVKNDLMGIAATTGRRHRPHVTRPCTSSRSGACRSGQDDRARTSTRAAGSS